MTAVDRVSHYNGGLFFLPDGRGLGFTPLIQGVSKPYVMDLDGRNKRDGSDSRAKPLEFFEKNSITRPWKQLWPPCD